MAGKNFSELNEIWLTAMDTLIANRIQALEYDKTVKCTVIKDKGFGVYLVQENDSVKYDAYAIGDNTYQKDDEVYVLIPNKDYGTQKVILSKYNILNDTQPINYVSPLDSIVCTKNIIGDAALLAHGIQANGTSSLVELITIDLDKSDTLKYNFMYDTLGISAGFKTLFSKVDMSQGNYGILLRITLEDASVHTALFDSSMMFGNPYNYMTYFTQSQTFDLSFTEDKSITQIAVFLYQKSNFKCYSNSDIIDYTPKFINNGLEPALDILVSNLSVVLGNSLFNIENNNFNIALYDKTDALTYSEPDLNRTIMSTWYNQNDAHEFIGFSDGVVDAAYDEDTYNQIHDTEWSGSRNTVISNVAPLKQSLQIYYNASDMNEDIQTLFDKVGTDLYSIITNLNNYLPKFGIAKNDTIVTLYNQYLELLTVISGQSLDSLGWQALYLDYLKLVNDEYQLLINEQKSPIEFNNSVSIAVEGFESYYENISHELTTWFEALTALSDQSGDIKSYVTRQQRIYAQLDPQIKKLKTDIISYISANAEQILLLNERLSAGDSFNLMSFDEEYEKFVSDNANKYCIYWYQSDDSALEEDPWCGSGWKRISFESNGIPGMPSLTENGLNYEKKSDKWYEAYLNPNAINTKIKAILFFNHIRYDSNVLTFTNTNAPIANIPQPEDIISINHGKNSSNNYQKYSSVFTLINSADSMLNRELYVTYQSVNENVNSEEILIGAAVYWYIPKQVTMLKYNSDKLKELGFTQLSTLLSALTDEAEIAMYESYSRPGYECFFKEINNAQNDLSFYYLIQNLYQQSAILNTIYCVVEKNNKRYTAEMPFIFSTYGTSGTQYTLTISPVGNQSAIEELTDTERKPLYIETLFTGFEGAQIKNPPAIDLSWECGNEDSWTPAITAMTNEELAAAGIAQRERAQYFALNRKVDFSLCSYNMLVGAVNWSNISDDIAANELLKLKTYYPVAQTTGPYYLDGPTAVVYNSMGTEPDYIHKPYKLFRTNDNALIENIIWDIQYFNRDGSIVTDSKKLNYAPKIIHQTEITPAYPEVGYYLKPLALFVDNIDVYSVVRAKLNDVIIYTQPIYMGQNAWESSLLNSWNESLTIDEENGIMLSAMMGAGYKDDNNTFNGVLMGDVGAKANFDSVATGIGLYGFHEGGQSFGFNINGTAFLGKSGCGRIEFNGNSGTITSANYNNGSAGMRIDLEAGHIDAYNFKLTSHGILIDSNGATDYFKIQNQSGHTLMRVGDNGYYLQSADYESGEKGFKIDLNNGTIKATNFKLQAGTSPNLITIDSAASTYPLMVGNKFKITWDGSIDATAGTIGGWTISSNSLKATKYGSIKLFSDCDESVSVAGSAVKSDWRILAGNNAFGVDREGNLFANSATIIGTIEATKGHIGAWEINSNSISTTNFTLKAANGLENILQGPLLSLEKNETSISKSTGRARKNSSTCDFTIWVPDEVYARFGDQVDNQTSNIIIRVVEFIGDWAPTGMDWYSQFDHFVSDTGAHYYRFTGQADGATGGGSETGAGAVIEVIFSWKVIVEKPSFAITASGNIIATQGEIGGWSLTADSLKSEMILVAAEDGTSVNQQVVLTTRGIIINQYKVNTTTLHDTKTIAWTSLIK